MAENAIWAYPEPNAESRWLQGYAGFYWGAMDEWYDEDERVEGHLRDPYHRVDVRRSSRHVRVLLGDEVMAETSRPLLLPFLPARRLDRRGGPARSITGPQRTTARSAIKQRVRRATVGHGGPPQSETG